MPKKFRNQPAPANETQESPWVVDSFLAVAVALLVALLISADFGGGRRPDLIAYAFACGFGALMLLRRRRPLAVLWGASLLLVAYYSLGYPAIGLALPVLAALYSAAERGHPLAAAAVALILIAVAGFFRLRAGEGAASLGYDLLNAATLMATAIALGDGTRARRALRVEQREAARLIALEHAHRAEQQLQAERLRIARELHDVIGHSLAVIVLQADVAQEAIGRDDGLSRRALAHVRAAGSEALRELRAAVKVLRRPGHEGAERAVVSLAGLPTLIANAQASGLEVELRKPALPAELPAALEAAAFRIIQESLTNVLRHADARRVEIAVAVDDKALRLRIADDGRGAAAAFTPGNGIAGMNERAQALGGTLDARARPGGGFEVAAVLPLEGCK